MEISNKCSNHSWNEDLDDVLNILGLNSSENTPSFSHDPVHNASTAMDETDQRLPDSQHAFGESFNSFQDPLTFQGTMFQKSVQNQHLKKMQSTSSPGMKVQSKRRRCLIFPQNQRLAIDEIDLGSGSVEYVPDATDVTDKSVRAISTASVSTTSYNTDYAVFGTHTNSFGVRSIRNQAKPQTKYPNKEETGNHSLVKRKPTSPMQSSSKLFGILSLILQVFDSPMTPELEERCARALQRALVEIQNAHSYLQGSQGQQI